MEITELCAGAQSYLLQWKFLGKKVLFSMYLYCGNFPMLLKTKQYVLMTMRYSRHLGYNYGRWFDEVVELSLGSA